MAKRELSEGEKIKVISVISIILKIIKDNPKITEEKIFKKMFEIIERANIRNPETIRVIIAITTKTIQAHSKNQRATYKELLGNIIREIPVTINEIGCEA